MAVFSIISPVYNTQPYLPVFLRSVLSQTFDDFELILVDDGSTDQSLKICREYAEKDSRIKVLTQQNEGAGSARNKGIEHASGKYVLFWDSDDWVDASLLSFLFHEQETAPCHLLIYGAKEIVYAEKESLLEERDMLPKLYDCQTMEECRSVFCEAIFTSVINIPWNKVFLKSIIDEHHIRFPDTRRAQDAFFNMEYYKHISSMRSMPKPLYFYRSNTQAKVWIKFPKDLYQIDILYDQYMVHIFTEFGIYSGEDREKVDTLFYHSILRTVGFCRNPQWGLNWKQKLDYIEKIITDPYNQRRAETAQAVTNQTCRIQRYIKQGSAEKMLMLYYQKNMMDKAYECYERLKKKTYKRDTETTERNQDR